MAIRRTAGEASVWEKPICKVGAGLLAVTAAAFTALAIVALMKHWGVAVYAASGGAAGGLGLAALTLIVCQIKKSGGTPQRQTIPGEPLDARIILPLVQEPLSEEENQIKKALFNLLIKTDATTEEFENTLAPITSSTVCKKIIFFRESDEYSVFSKACQDEHAVYLTLLLNKLRSLGSAELSKEDIAEVELPETISADSMAIVLSRCDKTARESVLVKALAEDNTVWIDAWIEKWQASDTFVDLPIVDVLIQVVGKPCSQENKMKFVNALPGKGCVVSTLTFDLSTDFVGYEVKGSILFLAAQEGKLEFIKEMIEKYPELINQQGSIEGAQVVPFFAYAVRNGDFATIDHLLKFKPDWKTESTYLPKRRGSVMESYTPLEIAKYYNKTGVKAILESD